MTHPDQNGEHVNYYSQESNSLALSVNRNVDTRDRLGDDCKVRVLLAIT
jgi:hypothetical protein